MDICQNIRIKLLYDSAKCFAMKNSFAKLGFFNCRESIFSFCRAALFLAVAISISLVEKNSCSSIFIRSHGGFQIPQSNPPFIKNLRKFQRPMKKSISVPHCRAILICGKSAFVPSRDILTDGFRCRNKIFLHTLF